MKVRHWSLFWAIRIQSRPSSLCSLCFNVYMCLACRLFRSGSPTKMLYVFVISPMPTTHLIYLTLPPHSKVRYSSQHPVLKPHVSCTPMLQGVMQIFLVDAPDNFGNNKEENTTFHRTEKSKKVCHSQLTIVHECVCHGTLATNCDLVRYKEVTIYE